MDADGIRPLESKVQAIRDFPKPTSQRKLREFLGLVNFYRRFVPHGAAILAPLNGMLSSDQNGASSLDWSPTTEAAFRDTKEALANASLLTHPKPDAPTSIVTDASEVAVGAVLQQHISIKSGAPLHTSQESCNLLRPATVPSTGNSWGHTLQ